MQRQYRLRNSNDFARLRRDGKAYHHRLLLLSVAPNDLPHNRYGFITSKALGNAVQRNRIRRQLREAVRKLHPHLRVGYDVVIVGKKAIVGQPFQQISRIVCELANKANLMEDPGEPHAALDCP